MLHYCVSIYGDLYCVCRAFRTLCKHRLSILRRIVCTLIHSHWRRWRRLLVFVYSGCYIHANNTLYARCVQPIGISTKYFLCFLIHSHTSFATQWISIIPNGQIYRKNFHASNAEWQFQKMLISPNRPANLSMWKFLFLFLHLLQDINTSKDVSRQTPGTYPNVLVASSHILCLSVFEHHNAPNLVRNTVSQCACNDSLSHCFLLFLHTNNQTEPFPITWIFISNFCFLINAKVFFHKFQNDFTLVQMWRETLF